MRETIRERSSTLDFVGKSLCKPSVFALDLISIERDIMAFRISILFFYFLPPFAFQLALSKYFSFRRRCRCRYTCFPNVTNADRRVRFTTSLLPTVTFTYIDRCVYAGHGLVPRCINLDGVSGWKGGEGGRNDVENTGINHSDDGKVKTDRSFTFPRFMPRERIQYPNYVF